MHSAQYLWITSYYAKREAATTPNRAWRPFSYFAILLVGGIALFVPGPWLSSLVFHFDFTRSFLLFTALVNIHHFILDGAIWKLRDGRIAALLVNSRAQIAEGTMEAGTRTMTALRWLAGPSSAARALRVGTASASADLGLCRSSALLLRPAQQQSGRFEARRFTGSLRHSARDATGAPSTGGRQSPGIRRCLAICDQGQPSGSSPARCVAEIPDPGETPR